MKAVLSVSFGTSFVETREKTIDQIDAKAAAAFPDRAFYTAWTSGIIVRKVRAERGEHHDTLAEAFAHLDADGVDDLVVATTCLLQGGETNKVEQAVSAWLAQGGRLARIARPLLATDEGCAELARVVRDEFTAEVGDDALLLMGHGSPNGPNYVYDQVQSELRALGCDRYFVATVEGTPTFDDVVDAVVECGANRVCLAPLMIVAGDHANNDLAGDGDESWKSLLEARGLATRPILRGLGEYEGVQDMICKRALEAPEFTGEKEDAIGD